jgi:adenine-specific DNA-methyltransferase
MEKLEFGSPGTQSADIIAENLGRLKELFPEAFTEGKVDFDVLRQLLGDAVETGEEKYGLNWHGKRTARRLALTPSTGTLRPAPEESVDWDTSQNLMIEGDNLEVLKLLQKSYAGKVKLIYIDPPYNTGNDFVYPDDFKDNIRELPGVDGAGGRGGAEGFVELRKLGEISYCVAEYDVSPHTARTFFAQNRRIHLHFYR